MDFPFEGGGATSFKKWLNTHQSSCNDNDDPDHDKTLVAANPQRAGAASAASEAWVHAPWLVPGFGISI